MPDEVIDTALAWRASGTAVALATVTRTWGSAPAPAGSQMAIATDGRFAGSVSGGCIEAAVIEAAGRVIESGTPSLLAFGVTEARAWEVGLACGGEVEVFLEPLA
ncbi:XdhC family protein [Acidisoma sp. 7E03]